jgi:hypothetical protein
LGIPLKLKFPETERVTSLLIYDFRSTQCGDSIEDRHPVFASFRTLRGYRLGAADNAP